MKHKLLVKPLDCSKCGLPLMLSPRIFHRCGVITKHRRNQNV